MRKANESKARDVRDLATVLLQALTQQRSLPVGTSLPAPFHEIVTNGISGAWGLPQISAALAPSSAAQASNAAPATTTKSTAYTAPAMPEPGRPAVTSATPVEDAPRRIVPWTTIAAALILALFIGWHFLHKTPAPIPTLATMPEQAPSNVGAASEPAARAREPWQQCSRREHRECGHAERTKARRTHPMARRSLYL